MPTYTALDPNGIRVALEDNVPWAEPRIGRVVLDFWRDLHWHMEAELTPSRQEAIRVALRHYDVRMVCRAIAAGLTDRYIQGEEGKGPYDKLETMIAITSARDNVERLGSQLPDAELTNHLIAATDNRMYIARWREERWSEVPEEWRVKNRHRLQRDNQGRYRRFMKHRSEQQAVAS